jgi:murein DD-endopeptidase MepM/ murein hydrolase activator NlpD
MAGWRIGVVDARGQPLKASGRLQIRARKFPVQRLTLPREMVELDAPTLKRVEEESKRLRTLYRTITPERLWRGGFTKPVGVPDAGEGFGARRIINGQARAPHAGLDYSADSGTPVVAANTGRVALVAEYFFPGRLLVLDHGLGLYTLYFHLERTDVADGDRVERGQIIGRVGASGRATGPHLHFAAHLRQARIDPALLLQLRLPE